MSGEAINITVPTNLIDTDHRLLSALSRLVSQFVFNGRPGAKVIVNGGTKVCRLAPEVESEIQDARILLTSYGRALD
jgi:hypothetical protein